MSTHEIPVFRVGELEAHPNADMLDIITYRGWKCAVRRGSFQLGDLAVYIAPDYCVPVTRPEFEFLKDAGKFDQTHARIKGKRLRGVMSFGLVIPAPVEIRSTVDANAVWTVQEGDNLLEYYGIHRWEPPMVGRNNGQGFTLPQTFYPRIPQGNSKFDLENINNYPDLIKEGEMVVMTEKIHGANARFVYYKNDSADAETPEGMMVGSRTRWLRRVTDDERAQGHKPDIWWQVHDKFPEIRAFCEVHPNTILYGEVYGNVQDLKYGLPNDLSFAAFAAYDSVQGVWLPVYSLLADILPIYQIPTAPIVKVAPYSRALMELLAEQDSTVATAPAKHMREGLVITPVAERFDPRHGRVALKYISNRYWERKL